MIAAKTIEKMINLDSSTCLHAIMQKYVKSFTT